MGASLTPIKLALTTVLVLGVSGCADQASVPVETVTVTATTSPTTDPSPLVEQEPETTVQPLVSEEQFTESLSKANLQYDEFNEETYFSSRVRPDFEDSVLVDLVVYLGDDGLLEAGISVAYLDEDWIFYDTLEARALSETFTLVSVESWDKYSDVLDGGIVYEASVSPIDKEIERALEAVLADPGAKFRLSGSDGTVERLFNQIERDSIFTMLNIYRGLREGYKP